ncbi:MAG: cytochrome c oxidase subunit I [Chloroflexi bacterium]|nr:cytochrome c oxidase subunit I [Chloroflexota bacterium]
MAVEIAPQVAPVGAQVSNETAPYKESFLWEWATTVDHKKIGILYLLTGGLFFLIGGLEALLVRTQLMVPRSDFMNPDLYNQMFTMHATTMIFLAVMPINVGLGNYIVPLMVGALDMAYPRLNAFSYWLYLFGGIFLNLSFVMGGAPNVGWFGYAPLTENQYSGSGTDFWVIGLQILGVASIAGALNFVVTILKMRAPGMTFNRMPLFCWATLVTAILVLFAFPAITIALFLVMFDRHFGTSFYNAAGGGDPLLWQHLFWFFGHPEVYILILPAFGIISEVLPVFSRKPIFGYSFIAYSSVAIGFLGFTVWAHHMFATGMGDIANTAFATGSFLIGVPTGVKIFNWIGTMWGGSIRFTTAMKFAAGFIGTFTVGGLSGIMLASPPVDFQMTATYFVVAHLHYVLFGGAIMGLFAGLYYWWPKMFGRALDERIGNWHFWAQLLAFNITFFPMHWLGMEGMPRRIYTYFPNEGFDFWNPVATIGSYLLGGAVLIFVANAVITAFRPADATDNPWEASSLEWATTSPPPAHNFDVEPVVYSRYPLWDISEEDEHGGSHSSESSHGVSATAIATVAKAHDEHGDAHESGGHGGGHGIHLPAPTIYPMILALGLMILFLAVLFTPPTLKIVFVVTAVIYFVVAITGWVKEVTD